MAWLAKHWLDFSSLVGALVQSTIAIPVREVALVLEYCYGKLDGLTVPQQSPSQGSSSDQALLKEDP